MLNLTKFIKHLVSPFFNGKVLTPDQALTVLRKDPTEFWVVNNSHTLVSDEGSSRAELLFDLGPFIEVDTYEELEVPARLARTAQTFGEATHTLLQLRDTWLPVNIMENTSSTLILNSPDFLSALERRLFLVVDLKLAYRMLDDPQSLKEARRLYRKEDYKDGTMSGASPNYPVPKDEKYSIGIDDNFSFESRLQSQQHTVAMINKYCS